MPVMKRLTVGGTTYDTVGEASVTQVQTSGTKIATIAIDGTSTDIYAPSGGSSVSPYASNPAMDGTASAGSSDDYARGDHVHPTDTSRAAASHSHAIGDLPTGTTSTTVALGNHTHSEYAASSHSHDASDVSSGTLDIARIPTGTTSTTVALGDHTHSGYAASSHNHAAGDINSGTLDIARIPTGSTATTVSLGNHTHSGYAASTHYHSGSDITSGTVGFSYLPTGTGASQVAVGNHTHSGYQDTLVSGTNIKTVGSQSLLGGGNLTVANIGAAASTHAHGNITSGGDITATAPTIASGDCLVINDDSASKVTNGPAFGTSTATFLANNGTWQTPAGTYSLPTASTSMLGGVKVDGTTITAAADGTISAAGGGGANRLTLYLSNDLGASSVIVYVDQAKTTTLYDEFECDYRAAYSALRNFDDIELVYEPSSNNKYWYRVLSMQLDAVDDSLYLIAATATTNPQLKYVYM